MLYKRYKTAKIKKYKHERVLAYTFNLSSVAMCVVADALHRRVKASDAAPSTGSDCVDHHLLLQRLHFIATSR